jgi:hypothetical protein
VAAAAAVVAQQSNRHSQPQFAEHRVYLVQIGYVLLLRRDLTSSRLPVALAFARGPDPATSEMKR